MAKSRELKRRIKAVGNIRRITKTMQMIATARFQAALKRATLTKPYAQKIAELVGELASATAAGGKVAHPLLSSGKAAVGKILVLVITSNRGLCGGYNSNVLRTAVGFIKEQEKAAKIDIHLVGKKGQAFFRFLGRNVAQFHSQFGDQPRFEQVDQLAEGYMKSFIAGEYDGVYICSMNFISASRQTPKVTKVLPLDSPDAKQKAESGALANVGAEYDYSPDPKTLLDELLPITAKTQMFQLFNEAVVSEQVARMVAMKAATDSAGKMGKELNRRYNRARQAAITTELTEIIAGSAALE